MLATIPAFMALSEIIFLRTQKLTLRLAVALLIGIGGVAVLMSRSLNLGGAPIDQKGALALLAASITWSVASALPRLMPLPESKMVSSAMQMLIGGLMLLAAAGVRRGIRAISSGGGVLRRVVGARVFDCRGIDHRFHGVCLVAASRFADEGWDVCVRQSGGGGADRIFSGRGSARCESCSWCRVCVRERCSDHDGESEED